jgi:uncharacterized Zn-binding protein involved in type VI secretion
MKALITLGCKTDHGGIIVLGDSSFIVEGKAVHLDGMTHFCPKCKVQSRAIASNQGFMIVGGKSIVAVGDTSTCGSKYLKISDLAVMSNGSNSGGSGSSGSPKPTPIFSPLDTQQPVSESFSKVPSKPPQLTDDDILLTAEESNQLFKRCFKQIANPMTLEHRKLATGMYWKIIEADEGGLEVLQYLFEAVFGGDWGKPDIKGAAQDIGKDQAQQAYDHAKNDARMKYFKVRSSGDIDGRIGDAGQAAIAGIQMGYKSRFDRLNMGI